jgi:hypothetical protein
MKRFSEAGARARVLPPGLSVSIRMLPAQQRPFDRAALLAGATLGNVLQRRQRCSVRRLRGQCIRSGGVAPVRDTAACETLAGASRRGRETTPSGRSPVAFAVLLFRLLAAPTRRSRRLPRRLPRPNTLLPVASLRFCGSGWTTWLTWYLGYLAGRLGLRHVEDGRESNGSSQRGGLE